MLVVAVADSQAAEGLLGQAVGVAEKVAEKVQTPAVVRQAVAGAKEAVEVVAESAVG